MKTGKRLWGFLNLHFAVALLLGLASFTSTAIAQSAGTFTATGNMTTPRFFHTATLLADGRVLIAGGQMIVGMGRNLGLGLSMMTLASAELYDPSTGVFTATGNMTTARSGHTATLLPDGKVLIAGGAGTSAELYDPDIGAFSATGNMTKARVYSMATLLANGKVLIAGGGGYTTASVPNASAELYDPSTGTFTATGDMTAEWADTATLLPNGKVLMTRGNPSSAELYDPSIGTFASAGYMTVNHTVPTAVLLTNGRVLVAGGDIGDGDGPSFIAEMFDPATGTFAATGRMITGREQDTASFLPDGTVLFAGGHLLSKDSAELYGTATGTFHSTGRMATGRELHTATLLNDGRVLIAGGDDERYWIPETILSSAELYTPAVVVPAPVLLSLSGDGQGQGTILHAGTNQVASPDRPAIAGEVLEIYCTGLGDGSSVIPPQVAIGGRIAEILYFGKAPGLSAMNQVNVRVPSGLAPGPTVSVRLSYVGRSSNEVTIAVSPFAAGGQALSASVDSGSLSLTFPPGYVWTASTSASWLTLNEPASGMGNGTLSFQAAANVGPARSATITIAGFSFTVEQQSDSIPGLSFMGSTAHIAAEENWTTAFTLVNKSTMPAQARLSLFGDSGGTFTLPLTFPQLPAALPLLADSLDRTLPANASLIIEAAGPQTPPVQVGSAQLAATNDVDGFAIFHNVINAQEAVVPLESRKASSYLLAFDNTNGVVLGVALQNVSAQAANIPVVIRDDTGAQIGVPEATISLAGNGHTSFVLSDPTHGFPVTANKRGTIEFDTPAGGQIGVLGIRFTPPNNALTTVPALANVGTSGGSFAHFASGNGWQTTFVLVNTGGSAAQATLRFFADNGNPLPLPLSFPQSGNGTTTLASSVTQTLAAGATLMIQSTESAELLTGSAQLSAIGSVGGFAIFRHNGQEAVVPLESRAASSYLLSFDNTNGTATGIAINTVSTQVVKIPVVVRDDAGVQIDTDTLNLLANGHSAFTLAVDKFPGTAGIRGTIEFATPAGAQIGALGIRIPIAHTFTALPVLVK